MLSASRLQHAVLDALPVQAQRLAFLAVERAGQAHLLRTRRFELAPHRVDHLVDLVPQLGLGRLDRRADLDHLRVAVAVPLRQLRLLALEVAEVALDLLHVFVREHGGKLSIEPDVCIAFSWL